MKVSRSKRNGQTLGIIGGLGSLAGGDLFLKLIKSQPILADQGRYHLLFEQHPFKDLGVRLSTDASMTSRKLYVFQICQGYAQSGANAVLIPCFASHTFLGELRAELDITIIDMMAALKQHLIKSAPPGARIGVLASDYVRASGLFERCLGETYEIVYPPQTSQATLMEAVYGQAGIQAGHLDGVAIESLHQVCIDLQQEGVDILMPGMTELSLVAQDLSRHGINCIDVNQVYANFATTHDTAVSTASFKLGIVGGVGPAATVDFMGKLVKNTPACRDQDHIKIVVEQNPQIPDRTANLLRKEADPTVAMYSTCKRLEQGGADVISIPCNTAHAFVERIQDHLAIPIVNMLSETIDYIQRVYGATRKVGLLATSGTIQSHVYEHAATRIGLTLLVPDATHQEFVMNAIYGEHGVKAGFTSGQCQEELLLAVAHLVDEGATVLILGCTELPLIIPQSDDFDIAGVSVAFVDPTDVLAKRCVAMAKDGATHSPF